ncbi:AT-rich interactive domain-containing protein 1-like isoform X2 [Gastrolobium bilobum]|nr:AT-rich interactive domain-containing protein 1-like isoform X2 [Gastrolobium bilobum]XP_061341309.1 AT-rich interactive domain-containing protein 1-like isoform X2 [Gastrolobium bilobum]
MLGDGQHVDLYKLFMVVKGKGGYDAVCDGKLWDVVGEESGLGVSVGSSVKLVYSKYLSALDAWMKKVADSKVPFERSLVDDKDKFGRHLMELQAEVKGLLSDCATEDEVAGEEFKSGFDDEYKDGRVLCGTNGMKGLNLESNGDEEVRNGGCPDSEMLDHRMNESVLGNLCEGNDAIVVLDEFDGEKMSVEPTVDVSDAGNSSMPGLLSEGEKCDDDDGDLVVLDPSSGDTESTGGCKRKRESMLDLLSWITRVARNPCDPVVGSIPEKPKWKSCSNQEIWKQVLLFREFVFLKRDFEATSENRSWQTQKMHPSLYDDHLGATYNLRERSKCDKKTLFPKPTSAVRSSSESSVGTGVDFNRTPSPHTEDRAEKQFLHSSDVHSGLDGCVRVIIPLGPNHQAEVPEWTGMTSESDSKWLGTQIWPTDKVNSRFLIERDPMGKGRQDSCGCSVPGSVECIRFHISEKRSKVKLELGLAFFQWNFDKSGEDVAKLWKDEDEKKFKEVVQSNPPSSESYFWDHIFPSFPHKSREDLVSYYFNVFLLHRRGYQNRHTPDNVDSDDDGSECGPLRNVFGHQTQKSRSSILLTPKKPQTKGR